MLFTLLAPEECSVDDAMRDSQDCSQSEYYVSSPYSGISYKIEIASMLTSGTSFPCHAPQLKVYAIFLGDFGLFDRKSFVSVFSLVLAVLYTFCASVVLLNVLIAIASDSVRCIFGVMG